MENYNKIKEFSETIFEELGPNYKEHIYVNAMCIHLRNNNYLFQTEVIVPINYMGVQLGYERADIVIYEPINCILEFKAQGQGLSKKEINQLNKYKKNLNIDKGILINFGNISGKLEYEQLFDKNNIKKVINIEQSNEETKEEQLNGETEKEQLKEKTEKEQSNEETQKELKEKTEKEQENGKTQTGNGYLTD